MRTSRRALAAVLLFMGTAQTGLSQDGADPWKSEISIVDPWTNEKDTTLEAMRIVTDTVSTGIIEGEPRTSELAVGSVATEREKLSPFMQGQADANKYYESKGAGCAGFASGVGCMLFPGTLAVPAAISLTEPKKIGNRSNPNNHRLQTDAEYSAGYSTQARKIRSKKTWGNFGLGIGFTGLIAVTLIATM